MKTISGIHPALVAAALAGTSSIMGVDLSKVPAASTKKGLTYEKDIRPIFEGSCFNCHGEQRHRGDLRLDSLQAVLRGGESGKAIIPGKSLESPLVLAVAQVDEEIAMPPKRGRGPGGPGGQGGPGGPGDPPGAPGAPGGFGGPGGPGGRGGFSPANMMSGQMISQADKNMDQKLTKQEFVGLADAWYDKLDTEKSGKLNQQQFSQKFGEIMPMRGPGGPGGPGVGPGPRAQGTGPGQGGSSPGGGRFGQGPMAGGGFFTALDSDQDGSLTRAEMRNTFGSWFTEWDVKKTGSLDGEQLREGLNKTLPRPNFGGGPGGGGRGGGGFGGPGGPGGGGPPAKPLTPEQVGLVRAWVDQGAK